MTACCKFRIGTNQRRRAHNGRPRSELRPAQAPLVMAGRGRADQLAAPRRSTRCCCAVSVFTMARGVAAPAPHAVLHQFAMQRVFA